jgi:hypothetical protein
MSNAVAIRQIGTLDQQGEGQLVHDGTLEALKWLALVLMTGDHLNATLLNWSVPFLYNAGRLVLPIFGFVLAYNLARPDAFNRGVHLRVLKRLALYGLAAMPAFWVMHGFWPFNVLWTLALFTLIAYCIERGTQMCTAIAWVAMGFGGLFVEFWWFGLLYCLGAWMICKRPSLGAVSLWVFGAISLHVVNHNFWALAALPLLLLAPLVKLQWSRRAKWFYVYYPAHLTVLCLIGFALG